MTYHFDPDQCAGNPAPGNHQSPSTTRVLPPHQYDVGFARAMCAWIT